MSSPFDSLEDAVADIRAGRTVIVCDGEDRENEGDLVMAAQFATPETINFMAREARGLICLALSAERCDELGLRPMTRRNESLHGTAFTVSIESRDGVTTGISAHDRAHTVQTAIDPERGPDDLVQPGHVFPLRARPGGVLERSGHTETAVDLARMAGVLPAGVICEILNEDGTMARVGDLIPYARRHGLRMITVAQLIARRRQTETLVERVASARLPTGHGVFRLHGYRSLVDAEGLDTVDANLALGFAADLRDFGTGAQILADLGLSSIRLLTNNPRKLIGLEGHGLEITGQVPIEVPGGPESEPYMLSKALRLGHQLSGLEAVPVEEPQPAEPLWVGADVQERAA